MTIAFRKEERLTLPPADLVKVMVEDDLDQGAQILQVLRCPFPAHYQAMLSKAGNQLLDLFLIGWKLLFLFHDGWVRWIRYGPRCGPFDTLSISPAHSVLHPHNAACIAASHWRCWKKHPNPVLWNHR